MLEEIEEDLTLHLKPLQWFMVDRVVEIMSILGLFSLAFSPVSYHCARLPVLETELQGL